jgi:hypothetical protein
MWRVVGKPNQEKNRILPLPFFLWRSSNGRDLVNPDMGLDIYDPTTGQIRSNHYRDEVLKVFDL